MLGRPGGWRGLPQTPGHSLAAAVGSSSLSLSATARTARQPCWAAAGAATCTAGSALVARVRRTQRRRRSQANRCQYNTRICRRATPNPGSQVSVEDELDTTDWIDMIPSHDDLEKWEDGMKWIRVKDGKNSFWRREDDVGVYRYTDGGYESKDENGNWVNYAQMPQDVSHLTDAQRERLIKELRGEIKVSLSEGDLENFRPMAQVPPLEKWPSHEIEVTDELKATDESLEGYKELDMSDDLGRAFFLSARWKGANEARRHLGYNVNDEIEDVANMNGSVLALRCMTEQLKRLKRFQRQAEDEPEPSDAYRLRNLRVTGLLGTTKGSSIALWFYVPPKKRICVDICIGDDCMGQGPSAEEALLRLLVSKAAELGADHLWCRSRRTESGKVFTPKYFQTMGFTAVPYDQQEEEEWETLQLGKEEKEVVESLPGLGLWMSTRGLAKYLEAANTWCYEMGAADILEVADNKIELADYLQEESGLTEEERERLLQY